MDCPIKDDVKEDLWQLVGITFYRFEDLNIGVRFIDLGALSSNEAVVYEKISEDQYRQAFGTEKFDYKSPTDEDPDARSSVIIVG